MFIYIFFKLCRYFLFWLVELSVDLTTAFTSLVEISCSNGKDVSINKDIAVQNLIYIMDVGQTEAHNTE